MLKLKELICHTCVRILNWCNASVVLNCDICTKNDLIFIGINKAAIISYINCFTVREVTRYGQIGKIGPVIFCDRILPSNVEQ